jgi:antitoxin YefM
MNSISYTSLRKNLSSVLEEVEKDHVTYHVTRKNHKNMVILAEEDYNSIKETLYLLSNQSNADMINESIVQAKNQNFVTVNLND